MKHITLTLSDIFRVLRGIDITVSCEKEDVSISLDVTMTRRGREIVDIIIEGEEAFRRKLECDNGPKF